jgi:hypothetical protein
MQEQPQKVWNRLNPFDVGRGRLGSERADAPLLKALLASYPSEGMVAWPVSPRVGNVKNNDPNLIEPFSAG